MNTKDKMLRLEALRKVMAGETFDNAWFAQVGALLGIDGAQLEIPGWYKSGWRDTWGEIEESPSEVGHLVVWHRNDGGPSMADANDVPTNVKFAKFALLAELAIAFAALGQLTYVSVGFPKDKWRNATVYLNGRVINEVIEADSLMGVVRVTKREKGKVVAEGGIVQDKRVAGVVRIEVGDQSKAFF